MPLAITSPAFSHEGAIPSECTCDDVDTAPELAWSGAPTGTKSLALIVDDPDAPDPKAPKMTNLPEVLVACRLVGYQLPDLDGDCRMLSRFAAEPRYPDDVKPKPPPTPLEGQAAVAACHRIVAASSAHLFKADS